MKTIYLIAGMMLLTSQMKAQVKIGSTGNPNVNAVLELDGGTSKGLLLPRINNSQMGLMNTAPDGLMLYNTTDGFIYVRKSAVWEKVSDATNSGTFSLPYAGTAATIGGSVFSITQTNGFGGAVYFTTAGGEAIRTGTGNIKLNEISGNTGIGLPSGLNDQPVLAKLAVRGMVGNTAAIFGDNAAGVAIENNAPGIAFNAYYNAGSKSIINGYSARISFNQSTGLFSIANTTASNNAGIAHDASLRVRMVVNALGNIGVEGNTNPAVPLSFAATLGKKISLYRGASGDVGFSVSGNEMRMYSDNNAADITFGFDNLTNGFTERVRMKANGNVGIGTNAPGYPLDVNGRMRLRHNGTTSGMWFNNASNVETSFVGQYTDNRFGVFLNGAWKFAINGDDGSVSIGSNNLDVENNTLGTGYKLRVYGKIISEEVRVQLKTAWPDYVFEDNYKRLTIHELENFIIQHKHLPNIPSAKEVEANGQQLGEMQRKMMEKIEELSLYVIELKKEIELLKQVNNK